MGLSMPGCPGQEAIQQQIDTSVKAQEAEFTKQIQALDAQLKALKEDLEQTKKLIAPISLTSKDQAAAIEKADASIKELQASVSALSSRASPGKPKAAPKKK